MSALTVVGCENCPFALVRAGGIRTGRHLQCTISREEENESQLVQPPIRTVDVTSGAPKWCPMRKGPMSVYLDPREFGTT